MLVPATVVRRQTRVISLRLQAHLEIDNLQTRVIGSHINVHVVLVRLAESVEGSHVVRPIVSGSGSHLSVNAKVLVDLCYQLPYDLVCLPYLRTTIIYLNHKLNFYLIVTYIFH